MPHLLDNLSGEELQEFRRLFLDWETTECCLSDLTFAKAREIKKAYLDYVIYLYDRYDLEEIEEIYISEITGEIISKTD